MILQHKEYNPILTRQQSWLNYGRPSFSRFIFMPCNLFREEKVATTVAMQVVLVLYQRLGRVKTYINGCIFKIHPLQYTVKYTSTGVFSKIGKFWNYTLWSIKRQNCLCTATGVFSKMKCLILFQKFYESICIWMSNTWIRNTWLLEWANNDFKTVLMM